MEDQVGRAAWNWLWTDFGCSQKLLLFRQLFSNLWRREEYEALIYPQNADKRRIQARKVSYARYRQYVENEISVDVIAPIRQYWLTHIIELIPGDLHAVEKERIEYLIDTMLNEINKDYFDSVRKSILDYILKD